MSPSEGTVTVTPAMICAAISATIEAKRDELRLLAQAALQGVDCEARLNELNVEIHDLKAALFRWTAAPQEAPCNAVAEG